MPTSRSPDDGVGDEVVDEATADEACVHPTVARKKVLKRNATWNTNEQVSDSVTITRAPKRSYSRPELGSGGVLDREDRKTDSANLIKRVEDLQARELREKERAKREGPQPRYMQAKN